MFFILASLLLAFPAGLAQLQARESLQLDVDGPIGPATSEYVLHGLQEARRSKAEFVLLRLDTPGGLDTSMREIIKAILASPVPVVVYVAPEGARAASAGTYILYAAHVAAMAPGTNLGAATPVELAGFPEKPPAGEKAKGEAAPARSQKAINDAKAYLRSLAQLRGRNVPWAERAVAGAESLSSQDAFQQGVIDILAADREDLLAQLEGREVRALGETKKLQTAGIQVRPVERSWKIRLLGLLSNPNVAYILLILGIYGLIYEFSQPGFVLPGVVGAIFLILAFYGLHLLPVNYAGVALLILGLALMVAEAFVPSFGALGIGGIVAFVTGSLILIDTKIQGLRVSYALIGSLSLVTGALVIGLVTMAVRSHRRKVVSGAEELIGEKGEAMEDFENGGNVFVHGEIWEALTEAPLKKGQAVSVRGRKGLVLSVQPLDPRVHGDKAPGDSPTEKERRS